MQKAFELGDRVEWDRGDGLTTGEIAAIHHNDVRKTINGETIKREADGGCPVYTVKKTDGDLAVCSRHELRRA